MDILAYYINKQSLISISAHTNIYKHTQTILGEGGSSLFFICIRLPIPALKEYCLPYYSQF